jgi:beta-galactosidase
VTRNAYGKGRVYYIGTVLDERATQVLMRRIASDAGIACDYELPEGVEVAVRSAEGKRITFVLNLSKEPKEVVIPHRDHVNALSGHRQPDGNIRLGPGAVEILVEVNSVTPSLV